MDGNHNRLQVVVLLGFSDIKCSICGGKDLDLTKKPPVSNLNSKG